MLIPTIIMGVIAVVLLVMGYLRGGGEHILGLKSGGILLLQILPLLIFAFIIAGMVPVLVPTELISTWIGAESGIRGILIGTVVGGLMPGGPYVCLPIAVAGGGQCRHHGSLPDGMVTVGGQPAAAGYSHTGLAVHPYPPGLYLFLPAHCRADSQRPLSQCSPHLKQ